ncbi:MAG: SRPBCC family protein, partial [Actinomycetota bacterium]
EGLAEVAAPGTVARLIGLRDDEGTRGVLRLAGVRELTSGVGILTNAEKPTGWVWSRVAGDVMDLALLGTAMTNEDAKRDRVAAATAAVVGVTALDLFCSDQLSRVGATPNGRASHNGEEGIVRVRAITINRTPDEAYQYWRDFSKLPSFMRNLRSVEILDNRRSRWSVDGPAGAPVEWEAEITEDRPNELIAWRTLPGAVVQHSGRVTFKPAPGDRGVEVRVVLDYLPPAGPAGSTFAALFGREPKQELQEALRSFKQVLETGHTTISEGSLGGLQFPQYPAQPLQQAA